MTKSPCIMWARSWTELCLTPAGTEKTISPSSWAKVCFTSSPSVNVPLISSRYNYFPLSTGQVIKAWDIGVATMKIGELCQLICKPEYAYGSAGSPPKIPPNATLVFEVRCSDIWAIKKCVAHIILWMLSDIFYFLGALVGRTV